MSFVFLFLFSFFFFLFRAADEEIRNAFLTERKKKHQNHFEIRKHRWLEERYQAAAAAAGGGASSRPSSAGSGGGGRRRSSGSGGGGRGKQAATGGDLLRFEFDGDAINGETETAESLELEGDEVIDVHVLR